MLRETGLVSDLIGELAIVQTQNQMACGSCKVVDTCGNGIIEKYLSGKIFSSKVFNCLNAKIGDKVILEIPNSSVTKASIIVYLVPLLSFIFFALVASLFFYSESLIIFTSLIGLASGFFVTKFYNRRLLNSELYLPKMVSIVHTGLSDSHISAVQKSSNMIDVNQI